MTTEQINEAKRIAIEKSEARFAEVRLLGWLREKLEDAEKALKAREQMEEAWRGGTSESWSAVGCFMTKAERLRTSDTHARIAVKCRDEVSMFKAVIERLSHPNDKSSHAGTGRSKCN